MYGDISAIRRRATQLREQGLDVQSLADRLVAQSESIAWSGRAAESMRARVKDRASHLHAVAVRHEDAADRLERHAVECERLGEDIARVERAHDRLVDDGQDLSSFEPPPPGHKDWLTVTLPEA